MSQQFNQYQFYQQVGAQPQPGNVDPLAQSIAGMSISGEGPHSSYAAPLQQQIPYNPQQDQQPLYQGGSQSYQGEQFKRYSNFPNQTFPLNGQYAPPTLSTLHQGASTPTLYAPRPQNPPQYVSCSNLGTTSTQQTHTILLRFLPSLVLTRHRS